MTQVIIDNPIINSPFDEPTRHFKFGEEGITDVIVDGRRISSYLVPIAKPRKRGSKQLQLDTEGDKAREKPNKLINEIRGRVAIWRRGGFVGVTPTTRRLLNDWTDPEREKNLFFCQNEALQTAIFITEVAKRYGDAWIENSLREANDTSNPGLPRIAFKMATGSGKTVVMAMLIAYHTLNKLANPQDNRFSLSFLIITPGITIRDRLRVLLPNDPQNYYRQWGIATPQQLEYLGRAKIVITNFHALQLREISDGARLTKKLSGQIATGINQESPDQMVRRVCADFGAKKNIIVLNDEGHHCYRRKPDGEEEKLTGDERVEAKRRDEEARVWISGIEAVKVKIGVRAIYDLSATPFFLRGSGYSEGTLFPWVVSDFALIDAIESGIVKVPRVPVSDDNMIGDMPVYRNLWPLIRDDLPKKGRKTEKIIGEPKLPLTLQGALLSLYGNYQEYYKLWEQSETAKIRGRTPPVFIVVCNNTNVSKLVFDYISGWEKQVGGKTVVQAGQLDIFRNDDGNGGWRRRPNTILVDSQELDSGEGMSREFKKIAAREIEEFKAEYRVRFPGRDAENLTDEDLLREVMNTVGKAGKLGEHVKCVVSVSMLTEGWDAQTVTHILGVRAFGTQLLCEQVVGRALRRMSYAANERGHFDPEYAEVYGVPFSFLPCSGTSKGPRTGPTPTRVRAMEDRAGCVITFPRLLGYRYDFAKERLSVSFTEDSNLTLSTADIPTKVELEPIVGESSVHTLEDLKRKRPNEIAFITAKLTLEKYYQDDKGAIRPWFFPQLLAITKDWLAERLILKDNAFLQLLYLYKNRHDAADRIWRAIVASTDGEKTLKPILRAYDTTGSTQYVDFDTTKPVYETRADKCHISHVVADTIDWEQKAAQALEDMPEVIRYVKNHNLGFTIPYTMNGEARNYVPDYIVHIDDGHGKDDLLNLIVEISGRERKDKDAKVATARTLWTPAVNNHGGFGRWAFIEIEDPWDAQNLIREGLQMGETP